MKQWGSPTTLSHCTEVLFHCRFRLALIYDVVTISFAWRVQSRCGRHSLSNILKLVQAMFLYSIYHQRAGKTILFHMRGVDFMLLILDVPLKSVARYIVYSRCVKTKIKCLLSLTTFNHGICCVNLKSNPTWWGLDDCT